MDAGRPSPISQVFAIPELVEYILGILLTQLLPLTDQEDPRSVRVRSNARVLNHLLRCAEVNVAWNRCMHGSSRLKRALFLQPDHDRKRSWDQPSELSRRGLLGNFYTVPSLRAPQLNPVIQTMFPSYHLRFWNLSLGKHCAYLIICRRSFFARWQPPESRQGRSFANMLLSQPPCIALKAMIWDERDETKDYLGKTTTLEDSIIECSTGVTLGLIHEKAAKIFNEYADVSAIKLTTI